MKRSLFILSAISVFLFACDPKPSNFTMDTKNFDANAVVAINDIATNKTLAAINIENKTQAFSINLPTDNFEELKIQDGKTERTYWMYLGKGVTKLTLDGNDLYHYPIKEATTAEGKELIEYYKLKDAQSKTIEDSLELAKNAMGNATRETVADLAKNLDRWQAESTNLNLDIVKEFTKKNSDSKVSAFLLTKLAGIEDNPKGFQSIFDGLSDDVKKSDIGKDLAVQIADATLMSKGSIMPNIEGTNLQGAAFDKSKVLKKVNLIITWTAYSGKAASNNKELVSLYETFKDKDVEFISISYDKDKEAWANAVKSQNLTWPQYSDLKGANSPNAKNISDHNITFFAIVDKQGKVLSTKDLSMDFLADDLNKALKQ